MVLHQIYCHWQWVICHERDNDFSVPGTLISLVHHHLWLDIQYTIWNAMHFTRKKWNFSPTQNLGNDETREANLYRLPASQSRWKWKVICCIYVIFIKMESESHFFPGKFSIFPATIWSVYVSEFGILCSMASWLTSVTTKKNMIGSKRFLMYFTWDTLDKLLHDNVQEITFALLLHASIIIYKGCEQNHTDNIALELLPIILILSHCLVYWAL